MSLPPLYKYLDVRGAKLTLGNQTFKHSKPSDFNDIEDLTIQSIFPEELETALKKLSDGFTDVIVKNVDAIATCGPELRKQVAIIQQVYRKHPEAAEAVKEEVRKNPYKYSLDVEQMRERSEAHVKEINALMQDWRVFCVSVHNDSERMWMEYAQGHTGIALRIEPSIAKDSKFKLFRAVAYGPKRPPLYDETLDFLEGGLFGDQQKRAKDILMKIIYAKTSAWEHEGEYRLAIPLPPREDWNTLAYHPEEITELYLGLAMTDEDKKEILGKAKALNPNIAVFQVGRGPRDMLVFRAL
jgi:Protein of unknown function (DUF2971)